MDEKTYQMVLIYEEETQKHYAAWSGDASDYGGTLILDLNDFPEARDWPNDIVVTVKDGQY